MSVDNASMNDHGPDDSGDGDGDGDGHGHGDADADDFITIVDGDDSFGSFAQVILISIH